MRIDYVLGQWEGKKIAKAELLNGREVHGKKPQTVMRDGRTSGKGEGGAHVSTHMSVPSKREQRDAIDGTVLRPPSIYFLSGVLQSCSTGTTADGGGMRRPCREPWWHVIKWEWEPRRTDAERHYGPVLAHRWRESIWKSSLSLIDTLFFR